MKRLAIALAFGAALAPGAHALEYTALRPEASAISFAYQQMGVGLEGRFTRFDGQISFDPAQPEAASARIVVPATVNTQGESAVFEGRFTIKRGDFAVGEGAWSAFDIVANEVHVTFRITAGSGTNPQGE